jgi:glutathione S-transferase
MTAAMASVAHGEDAIDTNRFAEPGAEGIFRLCGGEGSPYSNKMRAAMRFRRIPHRWLSYGGPEAAGSPEPRGPQLLPKLLFPDGRVMNDSTFLITELEALFPAQRSIVPTAQPALRFLVALFEDYCDEWLTKAMFHYRWTYDIEAAGFGIGLSNGFTTGIASLQHLGAAFAERQVERMRSVIGSNELTAPVIETSFQRLLHLLEAHFHAGHDFLFGSRPSAADFALFGQLYGTILVGSILTECQSEADSRIPSDRLCFGLSIAINRIDHIAE